MGGCRRGMIAASAGSASESVSERHPDRLVDRIADAILDELIWLDLNRRDARAGSSPCDQAECLARGLQRKLRGRVGVRDRPPAPPGVRGGLVGSIGCSSRQRRWSRPR